jgi:hypothetical protein
LLGWGVATALEHVEYDSFSCLAVRFEDVAYFEAGKLVLAEAGGQRHGVEDVVAVPVTPLAGNLQELTVFAIGQGAMR